MEDLGLGNLVQAIEKYCGTFVTRWFIRLLMLAAFIGVADFVSVHGFDIALHEIVQGIYRSGWPVSLSDGLGFAAKLAGILVALISVIVLADRFAGIGPRSLSRDISDLQSRLKEAEEATADRKRPSASKYEANLTMPSSWTPEQYMELEKARQAHRGKVIEMVIVGLIITSPMWLTLLFVLMK